MQERSIQAQERALKRIVFEEEQRIVAEQKERERAAEQERAARVAEQLAAEAEASRILSTLHPAYERRNEAASRLYDAIADFYTACLEIDTTNKRAKEMVWPYLQRLDAYLRSERLEKIRADSGLAAVDRYVLPNDEAGDLTYTVCQGIANGHIRAGEIFIPGMGRIPTRRA